MLPPSANQCARQGQVFTKGGGRRQAFYLQEEFRSWRLQVLAALANAGEKWEPTGVTAAMILLESQSWVTKEKRTRKADIDNRAKATLDSIEKATGHADESFWEVHLYKLASIRLRSIVALFDLGRSIEYASIGGRTP